jgi:uncharacterized membrane protein YraQ (UPF0718 family)
MLFLSEDASMKAWIDFCIDLFGRVWALHMEMAPWLLLGLAVVMLMGWLIRPSWWLRHLGDDRTFSHLKAVLVGIPLPLCSCSVIPTGVGLLKQGASRSSVMAFLTATPQTGVDSFAVTAALLGWPFAMVKVFAALLMGCLSARFSALWGERLDESPLISEESSPRRSLKESLYQAAVDLPRSLARPYLLGLFISVLITMILPPDQLSKFGDGPLVEMSMALLISLPLYVCATSSVPIALMLMHQGLGYGAILVFLMAGPASNLSTMLVVAKEMGWKNFFVYFGVLVLGCMCIGYGLEGWLVLPEMSDIHEHGHHEGGHHVLGAILLLLMLPHVSPLFRFSRFITKNHDSGVQGIREFRLQGLTCSGCVAKLRGHLSKQNIEVVSMNTELAQLRFSEELDLPGVVAELGFEAAEVTPVASKDNEHCCCSGSGCS